MRRQRYVRESASSDTISLGVRSRANVAMRLKLESHAALHVAAKGALRVTVSPLGETVGAVRMKEVRISAPRLVVR